ncbi:MAG: endonuclease III [Archaeoglobaceae archaeon]|nr:endonuclease III [Archaeoglobaceae archaeon]MCX8152343.1 endonuclease III [Archaeoglobaceae archaeon]MDW8013629.1 endonuclease III [Archaeoglobaceae archaeon]
MDLKKLLEVMEDEARKRGAPVFRYGERDPFKILIAAILSTRTRDEVTVEVVERLFEKVNRPEDFIGMEVEEIEKIIRGVGFYRVKARKIKELALKLVKDYNSKIPENFDELIKLPGVGRKVANVFLNSLGYDAIAVDTHVHRIANRIGLVSTKDPEKTEEELKKIFPKDLWKKINKVFVGFGQTVCRSKPLCRECPISKECKSSTLA